MSLNDHYRQLGERLVNLLPAPRISRLYLPAPVPDETFRDEFGFVFLADGGVGPFYVSMGGLLRDLWRRNPLPQAFGADPRSLLDGFQSSDPVNRALAVGTYNALSASLFRVAGFQAPERTDRSGFDDVAVGELVGMVGYFCPLVERLIKRGCRVVILEQAPQRVVTKPAVILTEDPLDLCRCRRVLCTASTLINNTLDSLLAGLGNGPSLALIGPSASGLPDPLFARGVSSVGGIEFANPLHLLRLLQQGESWGAAGRKFVFMSRDYLGYAQLVERAKR